MDNLKSEIGPKKSLAMAIENSLYPQPDSLQDNDAFVYREGIDQRPLPLEITTDSTMATAIHQIRLRMMLPLNTDNTDQMRALLLELDNSNISTLEKGVLRSELAKILDPDLDKIIKQKEGLDSGSSLLQEQIEKSFDITAKIEALKLNKDDETSLIEIFEGWNKNLPLLELVQLILTYPIKQIDILGISAKVNLYLMHYNPENGSTMYPTPTIEAIKEGLDEYFANSDSEEGITTSNDFVSDDTRLAINSLVETLQKSETLATQITSHPVYIEEHRRAAKEDIQEFAFAADQFSETNEASWKGLSYSELLTLRNKLDSGVSDMKQFSRSELSPELSRKRNSIVQSLGVEAQHIVRNAITAESVSSIADIQTLASTVKDLYKKQSIELRDEELKGFMQPALLTLCNIEFSNKNLPTPYTDPFTLSRKELHEGYHAVNNNNMEAAKQFHTAFSRMMEEIHAQEKNYSQQIEDASYLEKKDIKDLFEEKVAKPFRESFSQIISQFFNSLIIGFDHSLVDDGKFAPRSREISNCNFSEFLTHHHDNSHYTFNTAFAEIISHQLEKITNSKDEWKYHIKSSLFMALGKQHNKIFLHRGDSSIVGQIEFGNRDRHKRGVHVSSFDGSKDKDRTRLQELNTLYDLQKKSNSFVQLEDGKYKVNPRNDLKDTRNLTGSEISARYLHLDKVLPLYREASNDTLVELDKFYNILPELVQHREFTIDLHNKIINITCDIESIPHDFQRPKGYILNLSIDRNVVLDTRTIFYPGDSIKNHSNSPIPYRIQIGSTDDYTYDNRLQPTFFNRDPSINIHSLKDHINGERDNVLRPLIQSSEDERVKKIIFDVVEKCIENAPSDEDKVYCYYTEFPLKKVITNVLRNNNIKKVITSDYGDPEQNRTIGTQAYIDKIEKECMEVLDRLSRIDLLEMEYKNRLEDIPNRCNALDAGEYFGKTLSSGEDTLNTPNRLLWEKTIRVMTDMNVIAGPDFINTIPQELEPSNQESLVNNNPIDCLFAFLEIEDTQDRLLVYEVISRLLTTSNGAAFLEKILEYPAKYENAQELIGIFKIINKKIDLIEQGNQIILSWVLSLLKSKENYIEDSTSNIRDLFRYVETTPSSESFEKIDLGYFFRDEEEIEDLNSSSVFSAQDREAEMVSITNKLDQFGLKEIDLSSPEDLVLKFPEEINGIQYYRYDDDPNTKKYPKNHILYIYPTLEGKIEIAYAYYEGIVRLSTDTEKIVEQLERFGINQNDAEEIE